MSDKYDDIIDLPRPESRYPRMPRANRAAQFAPFAALTGHESVFGNFSFYSYKKACGQKRTVRGSKNSRRLSNDTPAI